MTKTSFFIVREADNDGDGDGNVSFHRTKEGAQRAMTEWAKERLTEFVEWDTKPECRLVECENGLAITKEGLTFPLIQWWVEENELLD